MIRLTQICVLFVAVQWCGVTPSPILESINIERKINIGFKPLKFRPITFIKEKWGPFGAFMKKHTIQRRDLDAMNTIDIKTEVIKPVSEPIDDTIMPMMTKIEVPVKLDGVPEYRMPVKAVIRDVKEVPVSKLNTDITSALEPISYFTPVKPDQLEGMGAVPIRATAPIEGPLFVPATPAPDAPPPPPPVVEPPPRFGGIARFFGDIISEIFNRLLARARTSFFPPNPLPQ